MKRLKIFKAYFVIWLFVYFIAISNLETFKLYFLSTLTFNIAIVSLLGIGAFMLLKAAKDLTMVTGTFGVLMYKKGDLSFYLKGIEKIFPSNIADKIKVRAESGTLLFTQQESDDILAWLEEKYSNQNKYNNFFIGTVLMIGLLGTFAGLLGSIASMGSIVSSLAGDDVDVGKIMADFAVPLSSMAVGFGSSLFGVISAILLSIKGYILNKAQETLLGGVENWLQTKTVESISSEDKSGALMPSTMIQRHQHSYMDIFVEQIATLSRDMKEVAAVNRQFQSAFIETVSALKNSSKQEQELLFNMKNSLEEIATSTMIHSKYAATSQTQLSDLLQMQEAQNRELTRLLSKENEGTKALERREHIITNMVLKQEQKEQENRMNIFQIADSIDSVDKNMKERLDKLEALVKKEPYHDTSYSPLDETIDFMKKHFSTKDKV